MEVNVYHSLFKKRLSRHQDQALYVVNPPTIFDSVLTAAINSASRRPLYMPSPFGVDGKVSGDRAGSLLSLARYFTHTSRKWADTSVDPVSQRQVAELFFGYPISTILAIMPFACAPTVLMGKAEMAALLTHTDVVRRAKALKTVSASGPTAEIALYWLQIVVALTVILLHPAWWTYLVVILFISTRQYALAVLLHDAQHSHLHANKRISNWLGRWLIAAPLGSEFGASQKSHLLHHFRFGDPDGDPDYARYCFDPPVPGESGWRVMVRFIGKLTGGHIERLLGKNHTPPSSAGDRTAAVVRLLSRIGRLRSVICVQLVLCVVLTGVFGWWGYLGLWALPLATLASFYDSFRIFCEHSLIGEDAGDKDARLISFTSNPVERFFFAPAHMNYHAEHHMFAYVPHRNLPALREAVMACPELRSRVTWRSSYCRHFVAYIRNLMTQRRTVSGQILA
jgi:fatty acid desaturase